MGNQLETLSRNVIIFCGLIVGWQSRNAEAKGQILSKLERFLS
jgi:hypothetical protein